MGNIKTTKKSIKVGKSLGVIIDKSITNSLNIKAGDLLEISFKTLTKRKGENK